ncbi:MAG: FkbM family methyltransferase [Vicinamibacterales bacterium]
MPSPVVVRLRDGIRLSVDGTSQTGRIAYATGEYEPATTALIRSRLAPGDTFVDVGANIGYFTVVGARAVGRTGHVVSFEPVPAVRSALAANLALNGIRDVDVRTEALSSGEGETAIFTGPSSDTGLASLRPLSDGGTLTVRKCRFDDIVDRRRRVRLVKIDVEGAETEVLEGMVETLERDHPDLIVEITDGYLREAGSSAEQLVDLLHRLGYTIWMIADEGAFLQIQSAADLSRCPSQFNAFCSTDGRGASAS